MKFKGCRLSAECVGPTGVVLSATETTFGDQSFVMTPTEASRLAAELLVAVERAERLESDMRAPG